MGKDRISYLLQQYSSGQATKEEVEEMLGLLHSEEGSAVLKDLIVHKNKEEEEDMVLPLRNWERMWFAIRSATLSPVRKGVLSLGWVRVAAAVIVIIMGATVYQLLHKTNM